MKPQTIKISIATPCHENWDKMLEEEKGKFCLSCQKTVVDFSRMTNEQIINYFNTASGKTCGRIAKHQLDMPISNYRNVKTPFFNKYVAGFLMALGFYNPSHAQNNEPRTEQHIKGKMAVNPVNSSKKKLVINGRVISAKTKKPIPNASITIVGSDVNVLTDKNGNYIIYVPSDFQNTSLQVAITAVGYESFFVTGIDYHKTSVSIITKMEKEEMHIMGDMVMEPEPKK